MADETINGRTGIILDGYTISEKIPGCDFYPELNLEFRPMTKPEVADVIARIQKYRDNPVKGEEIAAEVMAQHVVSWDLTDHRGNAVPINLDMMKRLEPHLSADIFDLIRGAEATINRDADLKN